MSDSRDQDKAFDDAEGFNAAFAKLTPPGPIDYDWIDRVGVPLMMLADKNMPAPPADESPAEAARDHCARCGRAIFDLPPGPFNEARKFRFAKDWHSGCLEDFLEEHTTQP